MVPTRPAYWNIEHAYLLWVFAFVALVVFAVGVYRHVARWRRTQPGPALDRPVLRLRRVIVQALAQARILRDRYAGVMHLSFFWGFVLLFFGTLVAMADEDLGIPIMRGDFYLWFQSLVLDLAGLVAIAGFALALFRRHVTKPARLRVPSDRQNRLLDLFIPWSLLVILVTGFLIEGLRLHATHDPWGNWSPVGYALAAGFKALGLGEPTSRALHVMLWWFHLALASALIALIPYSKLMHILTAPLTIFCASLDTLVMPGPIDFEQAETLGVREAAQLRLKQVLDSDGCTECGRCQDACPAYAAGQPLSPKALILDLRHHLSSLPSAIAPNADDDPQPSLVAALNPDALWSCVTCQACMRECPIFVEHVPIMVDVRRYLVMERAEYPQQAQLALTNLEERGTPFRGVRLSRTEWCRGLDVPLLSDVGHADYLFWVGCAGAFEERDKRITRAFAQLLQRAGVYFAILGDEERCTGDIARRIGHEYLFAACAKQNIELLNSYGIGKIVTTCPHCFHTLKNDYPQFGGTYEVVHHSTLLAQLVMAGRLPVAASPGEGPIVFHDPCYLGRYNGRYEEPRALLRGLPQVELVEMAKSRDRSFCCGAGGGHMWMEETSGGRINHLRVDQALGTDARTIATACPFCTLMLEDGVRTRAAGTGPRVMEIAELLEQATRPVSGEPRLGSPV